MKRVAITTASAVVLGLGLVVAGDQSASPRTLAPVKAAPAAAAQTPKTPVTHDLSSPGAGASASAEHARARGHDPRRADGARQAGTCATCHNERGKGVRAAFRSPPSTPRPSVDQPCGRREDDPQAARGHDAAAWREAARCRGADRVRRVARDAHRSRRGARAESGLPSVPARQPRGVCARGQRPARHRRRRPRIPAARHHQQRLRQRRRLRRRCRRR